MFWSQHVVAGGLQPVHVLEALHGIVQGAVADWSRNLQAPMRTFHAMPTTPMPLSLWRRGACDMCAVTHVVGRIAAARNSVDAMHVVDISVVIVVHVRLARCFGGFVQRLPVRSAWL